MAAFDISCVNIEIFSRQNDISKRGEWRFESYVHFFQRISKPFKLTRTFLPKDKPLTTSFKNIACLMLDFRRDILGGFLDTSSQELRVLNATKSDRQKCSILNLHVNRLLCK